MSTVPTDDADGRQTAKTAKTILATEFHIGYASGTSKLTHLKPWQE
ncbi:MAG TPA: hypothetical protein VJX67_08125 [Blastocatellia bacterium]|nr:hypothetical protein [Blastocatellia bacterium]